MKLTLVSLFIFVSGVFATEAGSQVARISIVAKNMTTENLIHEIEKQTDYLFVYNRNEVNLNREVSVNATNKTVAEILSKIFDQTDVIYAMEGTNIMLMKKGSNTVPQQEERIIRGTVTDERGDFIAGANVSVKGTTIGTITDSNGKFELKVPENAILQISYIGYSPKEITVGKQSDLRIQIAENMEAIDEVVVVGYGTQKRVNLTGAVDQVTSKVFDNRPVSNVTQALQGTIPNLNIKLTDGKPTRSASYNIRGTTSIGQGGSALVLIDGVEGDPAMLNPNDIASVSVLKDAASAAIYGARGTFGVVLITTKDPEKGRTSVSYTGNVSFKSPIDVPDFVTDGYTFAERFREAYYAWNNYSTLPSKINKTLPYSDAWLAAFKERREQGITSPVEIDDNGKYTYYGSTDYYAELYRKSSFAQDHNISVSGSSGKLSYYVTGRLYDYDGLFKHNSDTYKMMNLRAKGSIQLFDWLKIDNNMEFSDMNYHNPINVGEGGSIWRNISDEGHPVSPIYNPDGSLSMSAAYTIGDFIYGKNGIDTHKKVLKNTTGFTASFLQNKFRVKGDFTFRNFDNNDTQRRVPVPYSQTEGKILWLSEKYNDYKESVRNTVYLATNIFAEYEDTFAEKHYVKGMVGYNYEQSEYKSVYSQRNGLLLPDAESLNLALGESITTSAGYDKWRIAGSFFRLNYSFDNRYLLEVNGRYDGSSKFPTSQQWGFFPSVSGGWRISEEAFWQVNPNLFSDMKIRASYGSLGNGNVDPYSFMELFSISTSDRVLNDAKNKYTNAPAVIPEELTWETATTTNVGLDFGMLNSRFRFSGDAYIRKTKNMYTVGVTLPDVFGASSPKGNYADMTTKGWEVTLSWRDHFRLAEKPFNYEIKATLSDYVSKIDRYNNATKLLSDYYEGQTVGEIWGYVTDGLFQSKEEIEGYVNTIIKSSTNGTIYPGDVRFKDLNDNGRIDYGDKTADNPGDQKVIGNNLPRYAYSFNLSADWNNFFVSAFFQGVGRQHWYPSSECIFWGQYNRPYNDLPAWHMDNYWTEENRDAYLPRYTGYNTSIKGTVQTRYLQNVAYLRLKNLQVGYTFPQSLISKIKMQNARIYLSGENLWCWSPLYKHTRDIDVASIYGSDPDLTSGTSGDAQNYPVMRSISVGLSVTF